MIARAVLAVLVLVACKGEPKPRPAIVVPKELLGSAKGPMHLSVFDDSIGSSPFPKVEGTHLFWSDGALDGGVYTARSIVAATHDPALIGHGSWHWVSCEGTAVISNESVVIALTGPPACTRWTGGYGDRYLMHRPRPPPSESAGSPECRAYTRCVCALSIQDPKTFETSCAEATRLLVTATDDASMCTAGRKMIAGSAKTLGLTVPPSCD